MLRSPVGEPPLSLPPLELHAREPARDVACVPYAGPFQLRFQAADPQTETARLLGQMVLEDRDAFVALRDRRSKRRAHATVGQEHGALKGGSAQAGAICSPVNLGDLVSEQASRHMPIGLRLALRARLRSVSHMRAQNSQGFARSLAYPSVRAEAGRV